MDLIYQEAEITVIATVGDDPSFGLPGVTAFQPRVCPVQVNIGDLKLGAIVYPIKGSKVIEGSKLNSRDWTYQEAILSRRRLFFTEAGVIFDCPVMKCHETLTFPIQNGRDMWESSNFGYPLCGTRQNAFDIIRRISEYSGRPSMYSSDHLDGFRGSTQAV